MNDSHDTPHAGRQPLPVDDVLPQLLEGLRRHASVVLRAPTGAGKTTRVPPAILAAGFADSGSVVVLQPRRLAARAAARRIAEERNVRLGGEVGYQVRFDSRVSSDSRIIVMTEGILLRMLQDDPFLEKVAVVVFDEFHERNLNSDLALGMVHRLQQTVRPDLKAAVMSATLDSQPIADYLGNCPIVESLGRLFPVDIHYLNRPDRRPLPELAAEGVSRALQKATGDILVFLPGVGEIRQTGRALEELARRNDLAVMELYGDLPAEEQDAVLFPGPRRKVVLSTNLAETSVTIEGVTGVVDTGVARVLQFDPHVGLDRLELSPISQASADQRAGRAGRLEPGLCLRLWDERAHRTRAAFDTPEIARLDLAGPMLQLRCWGENDVRDFPWFEAPPEAALAQADSLLRRIEALDDDGVTQLGFTLSRIPAQPRIARLLVAGHQLGHPETAALAAALLSERDPFMRRPTRGNTGRRPPQSVAQVRTESDTVDRVEALEQFARMGRRDFPFGELNIGAARFLLRVRQQFLDAVLDALGPPPNVRLPADEALMRSLLAAFPDRLARRRSPNDARGLLATGRGVRLDRQSGVSEAELFLCVNIDAGKGEATVRQASAVQRDWLSPSLLRTADELFFHPTEKRVVARRRTYWDELLLDETGIEVADRAAAAQILADAALKQWEHISPAKDVEFNRFLCRVRCLSEWMPELQLPACDRAQLEELVRTFCHSAQSLDDLRRMSWRDALRGLFDYRQLAAIDREAPERLPVPSGSHITLTYEPGRPPVLAVRIQEVFGLAETPRIAAGRVPVLLHLLAPNNRPQQITDDLKSFWSGAYQQVRKDLRARYPKHAWPEDPWNALAESRPRKKR